MTECCYRHLVKLFSRLTPKIYNKQGGSALVHTDQILSSSRGSLPHVDQKLSRLGSLAHLEVRRTPEREAAR